MARLKTFITSDGLTDYVVAATSRPKALAAWDVRQDLFKTGAARETQDAALVEAAAARPGQVIERPAVVDVKPRALKAAKDDPRARAEAAARRKAQRDKARLKARRESIEAELERARDGLAKEAAALEARREALEKRFEARLEKIETQILALRG